MNDRKTGIGGSDLALLDPDNGFGCRRKFWYLKHTDIKPTPDKGAQQRYAIGHFFEEALIEAFSSQTGLKVSSRNRRLDGEPPFWGTVDGLAMENGEVVIVECKTKSKRNFLKWCHAGITPAERAQVHLYMHLAGAKKAYIVAGYPEFGEEGATMQVEIKPCSFDALYFRALMDRAKEAWENHSEPERLPDDAIACKFCPFAYHCKPITKGQAEEQKKDDIVLLMALRRWDLLDQNKKAIEEEIEEVKEEIARFFQPGEKALAGEFIVSYVSSTRIELDKKALEKDHPDLVRRYLREKEIPPYLRITRKGEK